MVFQNNHINTSHATISCLNAPVYTMYCMFEYESMNTQYLVAIRKIIGAPIVHYYKVEILLRIQTLHNFIEDISWQQWSLRSRLPFMYKSENRTTLSMIKSRDIFLIQEIYLQSACKCHILGDNAPCSKICDKDSFQT